jgi:hypothetical protein
MYLCASYTCIYQYSQYIVSVCLCSEYLSLSNMQPWAKTLVGLHRLVLQRLRLGHHRRHNFHSGCENTAACECQSITENLWPSLEDWWIGGLVNRKQFIGYGRLAFKCLSPRGASWDIWDGFMGPCIKIFPYHVCYELHPEPTKQTIRIYQKSNWCLRICQFVLS